VSRVPTDPSELTSAQSMASASALEPEVLTPTTTLEEPQSRGVLSSPPEPPMRPVYDGALTEAAALAGPIPASVRKPVNSTAKVLLNQRRIT
jgi:hypothetical protein